MPSTDNNNNTNPPDDEVVETFECGNCGRQLDSEYDLTYNYYYQEECCDDCDERGRRYEEEAEREQDEQDEESEHIHSYSYRPRVSFMNSDGHTSMYASLDESTLRPQLYLGYELEVEYHGSDYCGLGADMLMDRYGSPTPIYLKHDGSLNDGFEIVSMPGTLDYFRQHFDWSGIKELAKMGFKSWNNSHCGLHIHMSRNAFTNDRHMFLFIKFIFANRDGLVEFSGRESSYAKFGIENFLNAYWDYDRQQQVRSRKLMDLVKGYESNNDRYTAVNLQNANTIELRFFRPSLKPTTVLAALEFCDASFRYVNEISLPDVLRNNALAWNSFRSWVDSVGKYPTLRERLNERCGFLSPDA